MEAVIFTGIQASGKTSFYLRHFFRTHLHISLDVLKTRRREQAVLNACLSVGQRFVLDNTSAAAADRAPYIEQARAHHFNVVSYFFQTTLDDALRRNAQRPKKENIPEKGLRAMAKRLEIPAFAEGFDALYIVKFGPNQNFIVEPVPHEL